MDKETYAKHKPFAGDKKPSMLRRFVGHDYNGRSTYMITMVTEGRKPLFGRVTGNSEAPDDSPDAPRIELTELGLRVEEEWWTCPQHHPEIEVIALQMMPDHLHGILLVKDRLQEHLGMVLRGFKQSCNHHYRQYAALATQQTQPTQQTKDRHHGLLFAPGYNDKVLLRAGQLDVWLNYLKDNPRRLLMKREHPDLFRVQRGLVVAGTTFSAIGNRFLLDHPVRLQVQCSRRLTEAEIKERVAFFLKAASQGAVLVSPAISAGEKAVMRAAFDKGYPLIYLQENGFTDLAKPGGKRMEACASGQLLILAPWEHHNERTLIQRTQCLLLNDMARKICEV